MLIVVCEPLLLQGLLGNERQLCWGIYWNRSSKRISVRTPAQTSVSSDLCSSPLLYQNRQTQANTKPLICMSTHRNHTQTDLITFAQACKCNVLQGGNESLHIWFKRFFYCGNLSKHFYCRGNIQLFHQSPVCAADLHQASLNAVSPLTPHCTSHLVFPQSVIERG